METHSGSKETENIRELCQQNFDQNKHTLQILQLAFHRLPEPTCEEKKLENQEDNVLDEIIAILRRTRSIESKIYDIIAQDVIPKIH